MDTRLGTYYDNFINEAVVSGRYESKDEVIRKAIILFGNILIFNGRDRAAKNMT